MGHLLRPDTHNHFSSSGTNKLAPFNTVNDGLLLSFPEATVEVLDGTTLKRKPTLSTAVSQSFVDLESGHSSQEVLRKGRFIHPSYKRSGGAAVMTPNTGPRRSVGIHTLWQMSNTNVVV